LDSESDGRLRMISYINKSWCNYIKILPGEEICPACRGIGVEPGKSSIEMCRTCKGEGKIDWIQKAMGCKHECC